MKNKNISYKELENIYIKKISSKIKKLLNEKINDDYCQKMIKKALQNKLTDDNHNKIFKIGNQSKNALFPGLYYLCFIYIHPLTKFEGLNQKIQKLITD